MSIRFKIINIIALGFLSLSTAVFFFTRTYVEQSFAAFELEMVAATSKIVQKAYNDELENLLRYAQESARSEEVRNLLNKVDKTDVSVFQGLNLIDQRISLLAITNSNGDIVLAKQADLEEKVIVDASEAMISFIGKDNRLRIHHHTESIVKGLVLLDEEPLLTVSAPILSNEEGGLIQGAVIIARNWHRSDFSKLAHNNGMTVFPQQVNGSLLPDMKEYLAATGGVAGKPKTKMLGKSSIATYITVVDIYDTPALIVRLAKQQEAKKSALACAIKVSTFALSTGFILFILAAGLLEFTVQQRLRKLVNEVKDLKSSDRMSEATISVRGKDEVGKIAHGLRFVLDAMKTNRYRWMRAEKRLQELLEFSPMGIILAKPDSQRLYRINDAALKMLGYAKRSLTGKKVGNVFLTIDGQTDFEDILVKMGEDVQQLKAVIKCHDDSQLKVNVRGGFIRQSDGDLLLLAFTPEEENGVG